MKTNKKIGVVLAAAILVLLLGTFTSVASAATTVEISSASADPGAKPTTTVTAYDVANLGNFGITVTFDPAVVNVTDITGGPDVGTFIWERQGNATVRAFTLNLGIGEPIPSLSGDVLLATLTLEAVGNAGDESPLDVEIGKLIDNESQDISATSVDGTFVITTPELTYDLTTSSTAGGNVTTPGEDTYTYDAETVVDLEATPDTGYQFVNWTGDVDQIADVTAAATTITMNGDYEIVANFEAIPYDLTTSSTAGGSVTTPGEGTFTYDAETEVDLVATPDTGYRFVSWTGDVDQIADVTAAATTITMNDDYAIVANFERRKVGGGGGSYTPLDTDGDGYSDIVETLQGSDPEDPCDPDPNSAACKPAATPTPVATPRPTAAPTEAPTPVATPTAAPTEAPTPTPEPPGFGAVFAIAGLLAVAYLVLRRKQE